MKPVLCSLLAAAAWYGSPDAYALPLVYTFTSTISSKTDPYGLIDDFNLGDRVTYTVHVDSEADNLSSSPGVGVYMAGSALLTIGEHSLPGEPVQVRILSNGAAGPTALFRVPIQLSVHGFPAVGDFALVDEDKAAIPNSELPLTPYSLQSFELRGFSLYVWDPSRYEVGASITGRFHAFTIVPEPSSLIGLSCLTLLAVLPSRRKPR